VRIDPGSNEIVSTFPSTILPPGLAYANGRMWIAVG
jgi:hypothetical protein